MQEERENPMSEYEQFSKMISDAFDASREQVQSRTIKQRIEGAVVDLYEYRKFAYDKLKNKLLTEHAIDLLLTARGGIYAYCNRNVCKLPSNKNEKVVTYGDNLENDIFAQMYTQKDGKLVVNRVVLPESKVRIMDKAVQKKEILHYKELNDQSNATHLASLFYILGKWNLDLTAKDKHFSIINEDCASDQMLKDIADACIDGLKGLSIHNDTYTLEREIRLLRLFIGHNGLQHLGQQYKEAAYSAAQMNNNLTANASEHWNDRKGRYYNKANAWILTKIIKLHNKDYYKSTSKPLIIKSYESKKQQKIEIVVKSIEKNKINLIDPFTLKDISRLYLVSMDRITLSKNTIVSAKNVINYKNKSAIYDQLRSIRLWADGKKHVTGIDALKQYHSLFEKLCIKFITDNEETFNVFQGFKYIQLDQVNWTKIDQFLALVKDTISANDERVYEYLLNQFAFIVQNVGKKTETAIILKRLQGISKNVFINVLCELLAGYSSKNITDIDDFLSKFNTAIEIKMLAIANEMKNFGQSRMSNMDTLKSINTEDSFVINEKYVPKHEVQNVVNVMIDTNNIYSLKIENSDRRYVVCECNPFHRGDLKDISQFNPRDIPMKEAKKEIIRASRSKVDDVIINHFNLFKDGIRIEQVESWRPSDMVLKNYQMAIYNVFCKIQRTIDGYRKRLYKLKDEMISIYEDMLDNDVYQIEQEKQLEIQKDVYLHRVYRMHRVRASTQKMSASKTVEQFSIKHICNVSIRVEFYAKINAQKDLFDCVEFYSKMIQLLRLCRIKDQLNSPIGKIVYLQQYYFRPCAGCTPFADEHFTLILHVRTQFREKSTLCNGVQPCAAI
ncbi:MAG: hypothetical protein EZS28_030606, partial [Streblomastix strix]